MWNPRGQWMRQPYADPPGKARSILFNYQPDVWFIHWIKPPSQFVWVDIGEYQYRLIRADPYCFQWDGQEIVLRPGHALNRTRDRAGCIYDGYVKRSHTAFGGMPMYQIKKEYPRRTPDDFPVLRDAGLFNPWYRETPKPYVIEPLKTQYRLLTSGDLRAWPEPQRAHVMAAPAVVMRSIDGTIQPQLLGFITGVGAN